MLHNHMQISKLQSIAFALIKALEMNDEVTKRGISNT